MDHSGTAAPNPTASTSSGATNAPNASVARSFAVLLAFQCLGELVVYVTRIPIPGPVLGMVLFLCLLSAAPTVARDVEHVSRGLLNHLSLLFVPAGAGVMVFAGQLKSQLLAIALAIVVSTILSMAVAALVTGMLLTRLESKQPQSKAEKVPGA
jgi:holin-like protein